MNAFFYISETNNFKGNSTECGEKRKGEIKHGTGKIKLKRS